MPVTYIQAINQAMHEEMARDEKVMLLGEDVGILGGAFKATEGLLERFSSERVVDTPISETLIVGADVGVGVHGGLYHSQNPEAWFFHVPGLKVVAPANAYDAKGLLKAATRDDDPVIYLEHKF